MINNSWRETAPQRIIDLNLDNLVTAKEIQKIFGYSIGYIRRLRREQLAGNPDLISALPKPLPISQKPIFWETGEILKWGILTGRLNPETGIVQKIPSSGRHRNEP